jgi:hypothetical protein
MKHITLALLFGILAFNSFAQDKKDLVVSIAGGSLTSPYYLNNKAGIFYSFDFDYFISKRHILSVNYNDGRHNYYDNILSTDPGYSMSDGTNAKAEYHTFSVLYKYKLLNKKTISATVGTGAGIMTHKRTYPYKLTNGSVFNESVWTDLVIPVRLEVDYKISNNFRIGVVGGFYIQPDYPVLAYYAGPRLGYIIK